nr:MAG TPA: baseplate protein [Caudoviricetes sp.]
MDEYIKREAALAQIRPDDPNDERCAVTVATAKRLIRHALTAAPAADVAPVVRCKGCKHSWEDIGGLCCGYGPLVDSIVPEDFFCAYGKPKEG